VVAFLLLPLPELPDGATLGLGLLDRIVVAVGAYLNAIQFNIGSHTQGRLMFVLAVAITVAAGFLRAWQARDEVRDRLDGARVGAGISFGFLGTVVLLLWAFPMGTALTNLGLSTQVSGGAILHLVIEEGAVASGPPSIDVPTIRSVTSLSSYLKTILVAGVVFPATFGGLGGYAAVWYRDR